MDTRGHWHNTPPLSEINDEIGKVFRGRPVIEIAIGEIVTIVNKSGDRVKATFDAAEKNRVTLTPTGDATPRPYLELAEHVQLQRDNGENIQAQVWDNRGGKIILRTSPVNP